MKKRSIALIACMMVLCLAVGGTIAWLTASTDAVTNTFTIGDIKIKLEETGTNTSGEKTYSSLVPGDVETKDPKVTVEGGSENCYLFVKITETNNTVNEKQIITWSEALTAAGFTKYTKETEDGDVYYIAVNAADADQAWNILTNDQVTVNTALTKADVTAIGTNYPKLAFDAAAVQSENIADVDAAYAQVQW